QPAPAADNRLRTESVVEDRKGSLWIIAQSGLYRLWPNGSVDRYTAEEGLSPELLRGLLEDRTGRMWVASDRGLYELVPNPQPHRSIVAAHYTVKDGLASDRVFCLSESSDGTVWIGTSHGLSAMGLTPGKNGVRIQTFTEANGLIRSAIGSVCEDRDHNLWLGTE